MTTGTGNLMQKENIRLKAENEELREEVHALREFVQILNDLYETSSKFESDTELMPLLRDILRKSLKLIDAPDGSLILLDEGANELVFVLVYGKLANDLINYRMPSDEGIAGWIVKNRKPLLVRDVRRDVRFSMLVDDAFKFNTQSIAAAPLIADGKVYGLIEALNQPGDSPFSENDIALLALVCRAAGDALARIERLHPSDG